MSATPALLADEGLNCQNPTEMISYRLWQNQFARSADVVPQHVQIGEPRFRIVEVGATNFAEPDILFAGHQTNV